MSYHLYIPENIEEALILKNNLGFDAWILAGGTDLVVNIKSNLISPKYVISLRRIKEFNYPNKSIIFDGSQISINAHATLSDIENNEYVKMYFPELAIAVSTIGSKQIRNVATLIGNVCNASPAGDSLPALFVNDAEVILKNKFETRSVKIYDYITGPRKTVIKNNEIATEIILKINDAPYRYSNYYKLSRTRGVDISGLGICIKMFSENEVRISLGAVGPTTIRCSAVEEVIHNKGLSNVDIQQISEMITEAAEPISDLRATKEYRLNMICINANKMLLNCIAALNTGAQNGESYGS